MPLFKKKSVESDSNQNNSTQDQFDSNDTNTPSLLDFSLHSSNFNEQQQQNDLSSTASVKSKDFVSQSTQSTQSYNPDQFHQQQQPTVTTITSPNSINSNSNNITSVLNSGEKGYNNNLNDGSNNLSKDQNTIGVTGESKGINPEVISKTEPPVTKIQVEEAEGEDSNNSTKSSYWFKRLAGKHDKDSSSEENNTTVDTESVAREGSTTETTTGLSSAFTSFLPSSITGVNISALGLTNTDNLNSNTGESTTTTTDLSPSTSPISTIDGKSLPNHSSDTLHPSQASSHNHSNSINSNNTGVEMEGESMVGSIKDQILEDNDFDLAPRKTNAEFHNYFTEIPADDELIEGECSVLYQRNE